MRKFSDKSVKKIKTQFYVR